jgi:hypothetical protein
MAKSLLNQFTQTRGSRTYTDTLDMALAELSGRSLTAGLTVDVTGNDTVTITAGGAFATNNLGDYVVIAGAAYEITSVTSTSVVVVGGSPANNTGLAAAVHSRKNLEDDLNYIRTQLELIVGEVNWNDEPNVTLSGVRNELDSLGTTYLELTDTYIGGAPSGGTYVADNMLYTSAAGVYDTADMTYDPDTGDIQLGADGGAKIVVDADSSTTIYGSGDSYIVVSGTGPVVTTGGDIRMSLTDEGLALESGERVDEILGSSDSLSSSSTDVQLASSKLIWETISGSLDLQDDHNELNNIQGGTTDEYYHLDSADYTNLTTSGTPTYMYYVGADGRQTTSLGMTWVVDKGMTVIDRMAIGASADLDHSWGPATNINIVHISETTAADYTESTTGLNLFAGTEASDSSLALKGVNAAAYGEGVELYEVVAGSFLGATTGISGVVGAVIGVDGAAYAMADYATTTNVIGGKFAAAHISGHISNTITNLKAGEFQAMQSGSGEMYITNAYGIHVKAPGSTPTTGSGTNLYGLYIDEYDHSFTNQYNIYSAGSSAANRFEGDVAAGSLTLDNSSVSSNETLNTADADSINSSSTDVQLASAKLIYNYVNTISGAIDDALIWEIVDTPTNQIRPKIAYLDYGIYTEGNVTIGGNLTVTGTLFYTNTETVQVSDNIMVLNYGETGAGVTATEAGIQIDRGSEEDYQFLFDEGTDTFRVGVSGTTDAFNVTALQPVATREDAPVDTRVPWWEDSSSTFRTQGDTYITVNSGTDVIAGTVDSISIFSFDSDQQRVGNAADTYTLLDQSDNSFDVYTNSVKRLDIAESAQTIGNGVTDSIVINTSDQRTAFYAAGNKVVDLDQTGNGYLMFGRNGRSYLKINDNGGVSSGNIYLFVDSVGVAAFQTDNINIGWNADTSIIMADDTDTITFNPAGTTELTLTTSGMQLKTGGVTVNEVQDSLTGSLDATSTDDQLATAQLIWNTISGSLALQDDHNELSNIQGGTTDEYYHLTANEDGAFSSNGTIFTFTQNLAGVNLDLSGTFSFDGGQTVNEIVDSTDDLTGSSTDSQLATAKLIYNEVQAVTTGSGSLDHSLLDNLSYVLAGHTGFSEFHTHPYEAAGAVASHESTYNHTNYNTAYSWGDWSPTTTINASGISANAAAIAALDHDESLAGLNGGYGGSDYYHIDANTYNAFSSNATDLTVSDNIIAQGNVTVSGTFGFDAGQTANEIVSTITIGSTDDQLPTAGAVWDLIDLYGQHVHYELDLTLSGSNVWTVTSSGVVDDVDTDNMDVYLNGLLNRDHADYFTALVEGPKLTITYAYNTYESDWSHVKFWKDQV